MGTISIIDVTSYNVQEETLFCIKDLKSPGFKCKQDWFEIQYNKGLRMKILKGANGKMIGFIEYVPASNAWRPIEAEKFMFVHCIAVYSKKDRNKGHGSLLIEEVEKDAKREGLAPESTPAVSTSSASGEPVNHPHRATRIQTRS